MSLILEALHRSEQERSEKNSVPGIQGGYTPVAQESPSKFSPRLIIEIVLAVLIVLYIAFNRDWGDSDGVEIDKPAEAVKSTVATSAPVAMKIAGESAEPDLAEIISSSQEDSGVDIPADQKPLIEKPVTSVASPVNAGSNLAVKGLYAGAVTESVRRPSVKEAKVEESVEKMKLSSKAQLYRDLPLIVELSAVKRRQIPSIDFSSHIFSAETGMGFVTLNNKQCRNGDRVGPGLVVVDILADVVILDFHGTLFKLLALNSWVNL